MSRKVLSFLLTILLCASIGGVATSQDTKPLTNQDVTSMVKSLLPDSVILSAIKTNQTNFDVSANGLIALKKAGVSAKVMEAMLDAKKSSVTPSASDPGAAGNAFAASVPAVAGAPAPGAMPAPAWQPTVLSAQGSTKVNLSAEGTYIVQTKTKPTSLAALATDKALNDTLQAGMQTAQQKLMTKAPMVLAAVNPGVGLVSGLLSHRAQQSKVTYVWALNGGNAASAVSGSSPSFEVNYAGLPGVNPEEFLPVIVKLVPTPQANFRLVGATEAASSAEQSTQRNWPVYSSFVEEHIDAQVSKISSGRAQLKPAAALAPGEYAIALRPVDKSHKFSGEEIEKNQAEGLLFNYAWSFSVN
jgi:hypothetical protein